MSRRFPRPRLLPLTIAGMSMLLLVKSVALVEAAVPSAAHAAAPAPAAKAAATPAKPAAAPAAKPPPAPAAATPIACPPPAVGADERKLLLDLRRRSAALDTREADLRTRARVLAAAEKRLGDRVAQLTGLQKRLESLDAARKQRKEADWQGLVKTYEAMKPRDAAAIFNDLDRAVLLQVLDRMKDRKAAMVLAAMDPARARAVTTALAKLRADENRLPPAAHNKDRP